MICTFEFQQTSMDEGDPWSGVLTAVTFAVQATVHWTLQASLMQLVFGHDAMLGIGQVADWQCVKQQKGE